MPALTIFLKKDTATTSEFKQRRQATEIVSSKYYGVAMTNEAKVVIAKFKKDPVETVMASKAAK